MSNTLHALKRFPVKEDILNQHIVDTYFRRKKSPQLASKETVKQTKVKPHTSKLPFIFVFAFIVLAIAVAAYYFYGQHMSLTNSRVFTSKVISLTHGGSLNRILVKSAVFNGYAKGKGTIARKYIILTNSGKYEWSNLTLDLKFPVDFSQKSLSMSVKSDIGGEKINVVLKDSHNRSSRLRDIFLTSNWRDEVMPLESVKSDIDLTSIVQARVECDYVGEPSHGAKKTPDVTIYIKNMDLIKEARL